MLSNLKKTILSMVVPKSTFTAQWQLPIVSLQARVNSTIPTPLVNETSTEGGKKENVSSAVLPKTEKKNTAPLASKTNEEILDLLKKGKVKHPQLENSVGDCKRAVEIRREFLGRELEGVNAVPFEKYEFDYQAVHGVSCENVVGFVSLPVGVAGPLLLDGIEYMVPMATTEGALIASTNRGCKALYLSGGVQAAVISEGITRAPVILMPTVRRAAELKKWIEDPINMEKIKEVFNSTSRFGRLTDLKIVLAGRNVFARFKCKSGDAMGMNMVTKGTTKALEYLEEVFPDMHLVSVSGNFCTDKKPSAINWIDGRGKSVVAECRIPSRIVEDVLKTTVDALVEVNQRKNLVGSAMAGSIGGYNAHASNIVTALFIATGQDPAQNVESSNCLTLMENVDGDLLLSITMPSIEVGTVGGGTNLPPQGACLDMMGIRGSSATPGENANTLAKIVCGTVMAGELSLMSALAAGHLLRSHMALNRKK